MKTFKITFNFVDEFLAELEKDKATINRGIVRATIKRTIGQKLPMQYYSVLSSYIVDNEVVKLEQSIGLQMGYEKTEDKILAKRDEVYGKIEKKVAELGLELRGGYVE